MNPIQSVKNQHSQKQSILANTNVQHFVGNAVEVGVPTKVVGTEIPVGANVYSIDLSVNFVSGSAAVTGNIDWCFVKLRQGQVFTTVIGTPDWTEIGLAPGRNQVIKSYMGIFATEDAGAKQWNVHIKIPKTYQRTRSGDLFILVVNASQEGSLSTGARYKYYM